MKAALKRIVRNTKDTEGAHTYMITKGVSYGFHMDTV